MANEKSEQQQAPAPKQAPEMDARPTQQTAPLTRAEKRALWTTGAFWSQKPETD